MVEGIGFDAGNLSHAELSDPLAPQGQGFLDFRHQDDFLGAARKSHRRGREGTEYVNDDRCPHGFLGAAQQAADANLHQWSPPSQPLPPPSRGGG